MSTAIRSSLTDHSTLDGTGDEINGSEVDENGFTVADILDGTTSTDLAGAGTVDFVFTTSRSGLRLIDLDNAASAIHTALTVEWDPGDGGNLTDNGSGIGIDFIMPDDADNQDTYASINTMVVSDATTAEEGELSFKVAKAGTNTEVLTIGSGVSTFSQKVTVGVNDTGHDVKFFGASAGAYMEWDESADQLRIMGASADATTSTGKLLLATSLDDINANDVLGKIDFQAPHEDTGTDAIAIAASIEAVAQATFTASVNATDLIFSTGSSGAASEKFRFTSDGELGIGGANYGTDGQVLTSTGAGTAPAWEDATAGDITGVTAGVGLSGGGSSGAVTLTLDLSELSTVTPANGDFFSTLDSDGANEQKTSTTALATLFAGAGMTATSAVLNVIGGDGITANANDVAITAAQTTITSIYATDLIIGEDSETAIDFGTPDEIDFKINNTAELTLSATALYPIADAGLDLGTSALGYNDLHLGASGVVNFDNANMTITHSTGVLTVAGGTFAAAAITGTTLSATGDISFDGGSFVFNDAGADKDFRIEGDTQANLFVADASTDRIGIGTAAPAELLELDSTSTSAAVDIKLHAASGGSASSVSCGIQGMINASSEKFFMGYRQADSLIKFTTTKAGTTGILMNDGGGEIYINETANANMTQGLTIQQNANDNEILALKSSDVAHGMTDIAETDTYGYMQKHDGNQGGCRVVGLNETNQGLVLNGCGATVDTTKSTTGFGEIHLLAQLKSSAGVGPLGTDGNLVSISDSNTTRFIFDAEGSGHADVEWTTFSDSRLKTNVIDCPYGLAEVLQLEPKAFDKHSGKIEDGEVVLEENSRRMIGFLAQDVKALMPELVKDLPDDQSFYSLNDGKLAAVLVNAIQELNAKLEAN